MDKIRLALPVIVEGKYDKIALSAVAEACIITTDGFGIFKNTERQALIRRLSENGAIVLCDSDGAGSVIRSRISSMIPPERLYQLYVPRIPGRERRKKRASREGVLGVEGVPADVLHEALCRLITNHPEVASHGERRRAEQISKTDLFERGMSGTDGAAERRDRLAEAAGLPAGMSPNALLSALNMIMSRDDFLNLCESLASTEI